MYEELSDVVHNEDGIVKILNVGAPAEILVGEDPHGLGCGVYLGGGITRLDGVGVVPAGDSIDELNIKL